MRLTARLVCLWLALALAVPWAGLPVASPVVAQDGTDAEMPPLPRPRPDRAPSASSRPGSSAADAIDFVTDVPQPVTLEARISSEGDLVGEGLIWRIFDTTPDASGELALVARSEDAAASLMLPPGQYVVHVAYGRAQTSDTMTVMPGSNSKTIALEAGALRLNAAIEGDIAIPVNLLEFEIYTAGAESQRVLVADAVSANDMVMLNAGTYHVVSYFGAVNAEVRADLRIEPGQLTDATLYHEAAQVSFKMVSEPGGEAIADVAWTVQSPDGTTLYTDHGAFPSTVLASGEYQVLAQLADQVVNRDFEVRTGTPNEVEVLTEIY